MHNKQEVQSAESAKTIKRVTWGGTAVNIALSAMKLVCGALIGSQTMIADGIHSLSDLISDAALLIGVQFWSAPPDENHPYGHARIETIVTAFVGLILTAVAAILGYRAVMSLITPPPPVHPGAVSVAIMLISVVPKELLYQWTKRNARKIHSSALHANAWHHRSDALSSIPALIAIALAYFCPDLAFIDPIGAIVVACMLLVVGATIVLKAFSELTDTCPQSTIEQLTQMARQIHGVKTAHALRARQFGTGLIVDLHIEVDPEMTVRNAHDICEHVQKCLIKEGPNVLEVIVHVEPLGEG